MSVNTRTHVLLHLPVAAVVLVRPGLAVQELMALQRHMVVLAALV
jgi:hypothetical protein